MSEVEQAEQPTKNYLYRGNCHCGAFVFEVEAPELKSVGQCNCSICSKRGYLWLVPKKPLTVFKDEGKLVSYSFAGKNLDHQFCGNCGITVLAKSDIFPPGVAVNARTLQIRDIWDLEVKPFEGDKLDPKYETHAYSGPEPDPAGFKDGKTYHGSCHCGAVTTSVKLNGSLEDGTYKEPIIECNCSICQRIGVVWIYPDEKQLAISGRENLSYYTSGSRVRRTLFCKTCGTVIGVEPNPLTDEEIAALPAPVREYTESKSHIRPLNLRAIDGLDLKRVNTVRSDGWSRGAPYINP